MLIKKPPIVVILGHIDHGKTTLLDALRKTNLAAKEIGGITQKIGAYEIVYKDEKITFIDTPGHQAFNKLRERGVKVADIAIVVVAADEGLKPQTLESFEYLKVSKMPYIVALTKIDKKDADVQRVTSQLVNIGIIPEKFGGDIPIVEVSAVTNEGLNDLLEIIILLRDINDWKVDTDVAGKGFILESFKDEKRGFCASGIITEGSLKLGDLLITKSSFCKIKFLEDDLGRKIDSALPSKPFLVGNFNNLVFAGEAFMIGTPDALKDFQDQLAKQETNFRQQVIISLPTENIDNKTNGKQFLLIVKADNLGSLEALEKILLNIIETKNIDCKIIKSDVGAVTIDDINLAKNFQGIILSFNLKTSKHILEIIKNYNIVFFESNIIYDLEEKFLNYILNLDNNLQKNKGVLEVLATFGVAKNKKTIGGKVIEGVIKLNSRVMIQSVNGEELGYGKIISLEKNKVPVNEVKAEELCGLIIDTNTTISKGDKIICL
ncbi:MAG: hypothetical protein KatS3mg097_478 [Candidatus Parcubacteria bacterium]|nr:MAG: hypothetical protein KatS3mg097_478 [Candidatus Parcubacteria bacterium]